MKIRQIQAAADPVQDRLLLRIATDTREEIRVFLTRRFLRELWPLLMALLLDHLKPVPGNVSGEEPGSFGEPYRNEDPVLPLGSTPLLPSEAKLEPAGPGRCKITLREPRERSFTLALDAHRLQALCAMLRAGADTAGWDLDLSYGSPRPTQDAGAGKTLLH
ncbi:MAG TPA: hypothetical protein PKL28_04745 [Rhodocyclaceae bacterium]|jgi:hypothetical protein|nr:hypothetical protein [Rhodocyclaceae bacterium]HMW77904.1 hypothetical protein [Rhodocyclaceae bacterium]HNE42586.1 hypothetical protein [Rhodocyclaceae bacterium]HNL21000.1 hypothetical protein [Rhodocyclaceae bacterium]HNM23093.1 hypothetical protein [Rhodocyclaceae bacterium]